jgi:hypothetical protein
MNQPPEPPDDDEEVSSGGARHNDPSSSHDGALPRRRLRHWEIVALEQYGRDVQNGGNGLFDKEMIAHAGEERECEGLRRRGSTCREHVWTVWVYDELGKEIKRFDEHPTSKEWVKIATLTPRGMDELLKRNPSFPPFTPEQRARAAEMLTRALRFDPRTARYLEKIREKETAPPRRRSKRVQKSPLSDLQAKLRERITKHDYPYRDDGAPGGGPPHI